MQLSSEHTIPWDLIYAALLGNLSSEEEVQWQLWISSNPENQEFFNQLQEIWNEDLNDYAIYQSADETVAWDALRLKMKSKGNDDSVNAHVVNGNFNKRRIPLFRWASVAAIFVIAAGLGIWNMNNHNSNIYETGENEEQTVSLPDGSSIKLYPNTRVEVSKNYNKSDRVVALKSGEAFFEVKHDEEIPFVVNMETTSVKDLGTSFSIQRSKDNVKVSVTSGEVAFTSNINNETRKLSAGMSLKFQNGIRNSLPIIVLDSVSVSNQNLLHFENTALLDVILKLQEGYNKKIVLMDTALAQKRLTADLEGQSYESAIDIICKSLNIKYFEENSVYYFKEE